LLTRFFRKRNVRTLSPFSAFYSFLQVINDKALFIFFLVPYQSLKMHQSFSDNFHNFGLHNHRINHALIPIVTGLNFSP
jgi:hypothetical protein